jgi:hypothetical protein
MAHKQMSFFGPFLRNKVSSLPEHPQHSSFKKLIISTPRLIQGLRMMSLANAVPKCIRDKECKRFTLQKCPPAPYVPKKDLVQETLSTPKSDQSLKTTMGEDAELCLLIWQCGTCKAFFMHVRTALDTIKKQGIFKAYKEAVEAYVEQHKAAKHAKAALALLITNSSC